MQKIKKNIDTSKYKIIGIFIIPPTMDELKRRMKLRNTEHDPADIEKRIEDAIYEIKNKDVFDYTVINDNLEKCIQEIKNIIKNNS